MILPDPRIEQARILLQDWVNKQGHDRCWYYPEIFGSLCNLFGIVTYVEINLPTQKEFEEGCRKYTREQYNKCSPN